MTSGPLLLRISIVAPLLLAVGAILILGPEYELITAEGPVRSGRQRFELEELFLIGALMTIASAAVALLNRATMLREWKQRRDVEQEANHDALTGLSNRRQFLRRAEQALEEARRGGLQCALLLIDLDGFKPVNDLHGHEAGDAVLVEVAARLRKGLPFVRDVARLGGDEFAVLLAPRADLSLLAKSAARSCQAKIAEPIAVDGHVLRVGASVGIGTSSGEIVDVAGLLRAADRAMYDSKRSRGGRRAA